MPNHVPSHSSWQVACLDPSRHAAADAAHEAAAAIFALLQAGRRRNIGKGSMPNALAAHLAEKIDAWPAIKATTERDREDMIRQTCWTWFSGGGTAVAAARRIEEALRG